MGDITELTEFLFVYGSLRNGFKNRYARFLQMGSELLGTAYTLGKLYDIGGYPGLKLSNDVTEQVWGDIYRVGNAQKIYPMLDIYEESGNAFPKPNEYIKELISVNFNGGELSAICYMYNRPVENLPRIHSGDFMLYRELV